MRKILIVIILFCFQVSSAFATTPPIELSEINFKNKESDWIEIAINALPAHKIIIKDDGKITEIKPSQITNQKFILIHFKSTEEKTETKGDILHLYTNQKGITGTTEQIVIESDSKIIDVACWKNATPTESEEFDIKKLKKSDSWYQECLNSDQIEKGQSIAKINGLWQILTHPTPGKTNVFTNSPPTAKIEIQKTDSQTQVSLFQIENNIPFSINLDGSQSYDPDGDSITYYWIYPNKTIDSKNPRPYQFKTSGKYEISLTVTDEFGASDTEIIKIIALNKEEDLRSNTLIEKIISNQTNNERKRDYKSSSWQYYLLMMAGVGVFGMYFVGRAQTCGR